MDVIAKVLFNGTFDFFLSCIFVMYCMSQGRAKLMYAAGYRSLGSVAMANPEDLVKSVQHMPRKVARQIVASAKVSQSHPLKSNNSQNSVKRATWGSA